MSNTRRSSSDRRQHGHASDPVYVAAQGIQGTIATKKAGLSTNASARSLVFFLQALSLKELAGRPNPGGLTGWVRKFLAEFPDRIGTEAMHKHGMRPGQVYDTAQAREVRAEVQLAAIGGRGSYVEKFPLDDDVVMCFHSYKESKLNNGVRSYPAEVFVKRCRQLAEQNLENFFVALCTDPRLVIVMPGEDGHTAFESVRERRVQEEIADDLNPFLGSLQPADVGYFQDIIGALLEFQKRVEAQFRSEFAETSIACRVFETLDAGLLLRRIVMVNGIEGVGKSESVKSWCARHLGEARYVGLTSINNKTVFFRTIARSLGLPSSQTLTTVQLQSRVEEMLQRSGLMLVVDESHFMFKNSERSKATPEQVDWVYSALDNRGVGAALICTPQFDTLMERARVASEWNSRQFKRRIKRITILPVRPTRADFEAIAGKLLPEAAESVIKLLVGYAGSQAAHHLDALTDAIREATALAGSACAVKYAHVEAVIKGVLADTALAKNAVFAPPKPGKRPKAGSPAAAPDLRNRVAAPLQPENFEESEHALPCARGELVVV